MNINEFAEKTGFAPIHFLGEWNGYNVYEHTGIKIRSTTIP